jgi:dephospho-CoA kinase
MNIIAFVGMPGAGKSIAADVARELNIPVISGGDLLRKEIISQGLELTDSNVGSLANRLRKEKGMDAIAKMCIPEINKLNTNVVLIDGIRNLEEIDRFKIEYGDNFCLIGIDAPINVRYERLRSRARQDDINSIDSLKKRDDRELSWGIDKAINTSNILIKNIRSTEEFKSEIRSILSKFS